MKYMIDPVAKPRMTRSDKWKQRTCVMRYRAFKDQVRALGIKVPDSGSHILFTLKMPDSWGKQRKEIMNGQPHQTTPDKDNLEKGLLDAIYEKDEHIWDSRVTKVWGYESSITVRPRDWKPTETEATIGKSTLKGTP